MLPLAAFALQVNEKAIGFLKTDYELLQPAGAGFNANALTYAVLHVA